MRILLGEKQMDKLVYVAGDVYHAEYFYGGSSIPVKGFVFSLFVQGDGYRNEYFNYQVFPAKEGARKAMHKAVNLSRS